MTRKIQGCDSNQNAMLFIVVLHDIGIFPIFTYSKMYSRDFDTTLCNYTLNGKRYMVNCAIPICPVFSRAMPTALKEAKI